MKQVFDIWGRLPENQQVERFPSLSIVQGEKIGEQLVLRQPVFLLGPQGIPLGVVLHVGKEQVGPFGVHQDQIDAALLAGAKVDIILVSRSNRHPVAHPAKPVAFGLIEEAHLNGEVGGRRGGPAGRTCKEVIGI